MDASDTTRDRIRAVAVDLFTEQGYDRTSLREIADRVRITKASLYYHFPSKQALLLAIVEPFLADWTATVEAAERLVRTPANIRFVLEREIDAMLRHREATAMLIRDAAAVVTALAPKLEDFKQIGARMRTWLAGPDPSAADVIRAMAAVETLRATLAAAALPELPEDEVRRVVLEAAVSVLGLPDAAEPRDREVARLPRHELTPTQRDHEVAAAS
jgi:AcrR family transcriptional regulator